MPGPPPKHPAMRRRRNKVAGAATLSPTGPGKPAPPLPDRGCSVCDGAGEVPGNGACPACGGSGIEAWHPMVVAWWKDVWASPMANEYVESDKHGLFVLAQLHDQFWKTGERELAGEIRLQEQRFGLSPMDRRRLQWQIVTTEDRLKGRNKSPRAAQQPARANDPRKVLSMIRGGKRS